MSMIMGTLRMGRAQAESRFTETFTFFSSLRGVDPDTLEDADIETDLYTEVPGRVKYPTLTVSDSSAVGQTFATQDVNVHVAVGAVPLVHENHFCRVTWSTVDPGLIGRKFRVKGSPASGQVTAHRIPVEEVN